MPGRRVVFIRNRRGGGSGFVTLNGGGGGIQTVQPVSSYVSTSLPNPAPFNPIPAPPTGIFSTPKKKKTKTQPPSVPTSVTNYMTHPLDPNAPFAMDMTMGQAAERLAGVPLVPMQIAANISDQQYREQRFKDLQAAASQLSLSNVGKNLQQAAEGGLVSMFGVDADRNKRIDAKKAKDRVIAPKNIVQRAAKLEVSRRWAFVMSRVFKNIPGNTSKAVKKPKPMIKRLTKRSR